MIDDGYTAYCDYLAAGGSFEEALARNTICECLELYNSNNIEKVKMGLQNWGRSHLKLLNR